MDNVYADIAQRTGGNVYIGVVGPVRTGKSTLIKRIMETLVIPNMDDPYRQERARDELPQCGSGRVIMTSEPKFVPEEAVEISPEADTRLRIRMIDSVGYMVAGASGAMEDGKPRMVTTPWFDYEIPMTQAAELGTKKVMDEHCSIALVVTTDGTLTDIPRQDYLEAEKRAIEDMRSTGKPFLVIVNSREPSGASALEVKEYLKKALGIDAITADCQALSPGDIRCLIEALLERFPLTQLRLHLPRWLDSLEAEHPVKASVYRCLLDASREMQSICDTSVALDSLKSLNCVQDVTKMTTDLGKGIVDVSIRFPEKLFYEILSDRAGIPISGDGQLLQLLTELTVTKQAYDKISDALNAVSATGYGIVMPTADQMHLDTPEIVKKGGAYGVKLKASAPSIHMIRIDIDTQISPMVGDEKQSQDLVNYLAGEAPEKLWESNIFGKSVYELIQEGISAKLLATPEDVRGKFRGTLGRIVNEGATGLICLIL